MDLKREANALRFWRGMIFPNWRQVFLSSLNGSALIVAGLLLLMVRLGGGSGLTISSVAGVALGFAGVGAAASVAALTLTLGFAQGMPSESWVFRDVLPRGGTPLESLARVFAWAGTVQLALVGVAALALALGGDRLLLPKAASWLHVAGLYGGLVVFVLALLQVFVVLQTLAQLSILLVNFHGQKS